MGKAKIPRVLHKEDILALDIATHCGYCSAFDNGTWDFTEKKTNNYAEHKDFRDTLIKYITEHGIKVITAEDVTVSTFFHSMRKLSEYRGVLLEVCDELDLPEPLFVNTSAIKKFATGNGKATKEEMIRAMVTRYGKTPVDDNACDAFWLYMLILSRYRI